MMRRVIAVIMLLLSTLLFSACSGGIHNPGNSREQYFPEEYQVKNRADGEISAFGLNIAPADEMGDWVVDWVSSVTVGKGVQYFIYSDPDSWDVYLYYQEKQAEIQTLTNDDVAVEYSDGTLSVYVTANPADDILADEKEKWILHFAAKPFGAWPSEIKLYWNDSEVLCDAVDIRE